MLIYSLFIFGEIMSLNINELGNRGIIVGAGIAIAPAAATGLIACSKIILVNIIADTAIRLLTLGAFRASVSGISFVAVPILWEISLAMAIIGGSIVAISIIAILTDSLYQRYFAKLPDEPQSQSV